MTLLEILRRELRAWPEGVVALAQDSDGEMAAAYRAGYNKEPHYFLITGGHVWAQGCWFAAVDQREGDIFWRLPVADDASTAIVTREMWEGLPDGA